MNNRLLLFITILLLFCSCQKNENFTNITKSFYPEFAIALEKLGYIPDANHITTEDVKNITQLDIHSRCMCVSPIVEWWGVKLTSLDGIEHFENLEILNCDDNNLTVLNLNNNPKLRELYCSNNQLSELNLTTLEKLEELCCHSNPITDLDLSHNTLLKKLQCSTTQINRLDVSHNILLQELRCRSTQIETIELNNNPLMETRSIDHNRLHSIDIANCPNLSTLSCYGNRLGKIDISNNQALTYISFCYNLGKDGILEIISWFDQANIPAELLS